MIKLIVFDLDGVLVSAKDIHYISLNNALSTIDPKYEISLEEHRKKYNGLPTMKKLKMLTKDKDLPEKYYEQIYTDKQTYIFDLIREKIKRDERLINILKKLKHDGYKVYVASNAIRETVKLFLYYTGLIEYVDYYISNEDVINSKPNAEIYLKCMIHAGVNPEETLILEDSPIGIESAKNSKGQLLVVENPDSLTYEKIINEIRYEKNMSKIKLSNFNILIPMAGEGSRFQQAGYTFIKPMIEINEKPMIQLVVENLGFEANYIYVVRKEHYEKYNLKSFLNLITPNCKIVQVDKLTEGAACTTLLAKEYINNNNPLIIANSDQFIEWNPIDFYYKMIETKADGGIVTFSASHPKWSYAKLDENNNVIEVAEKNPISNLGTVGIYYYKKGSDYVKYAEQMITKNIRVKNEFYVCPVFNEFILDGKKIKTFDVEKMWGLGDPESLQHFIKNYNK
jgi:HAD superfamily hydrolase (TIGR01509 family)